jgi:sugar phosphate isomerase/epimerase
MAELCYETIQFSPFIDPASDADLPRQIRAAAAAGFEWIGIDAPSVAQFRARGGTLAELARMLRDAGLRCLDVQPLIVRADADQTLADARETAELAHALGAPWIQAGLVDPPGAAVLDNLARAADVARTAGAGLALEYLPFTPLRSIRDTLAAIDAAGVPDARVVVDTWHFFHGPETWADLDGLPLERLAYPQFDDAPALASDDLMYETTQRRALPGEGRFDLGRFAGSLRGRGWDGPVSVELLSAEMRAWPRELFARRAHDASRAYWSG